MASPVRRPAVCGLGALCHIYIYVLLSFVCYDLSCYVIVGAGVFVFLDFLLHIYMQAHEVAGPPGASFKFICRPMRFPGLVGPPSHLYAGPSFFGVSLTLLQIYGQVHLRFQGPLGPPSNLYTGP